MADRLVDGLARALATGLTRRSALHLMLLTVISGPAAMACAGDRLGGCSAGYCMGTDGHCYGGCGSGSFCTTSAGTGCGAPSAGGVYCCRGGGQPISNPTPTATSTNICDGHTGYTFNYLTRTWCANGTPYYYPGTHGGHAAGCYASCPYINDCGTRFTRC